MVWNWHHHLTRGSFLGSEKIEQYQAFLIDGKTPHIWFIKIDYMFIAQDIT